MTSLKTIITAVALEFDLNAADLLGRERKRDVSHPRCIAYWLISKLTGATPPEIGRIFGRDRSTIHTGLELAEWLAANPDYEPRVTELAKTLSHDPWVSAAPFTTNRATAQPHA